MKRKTPSELQTLATHIASNYIAIVSRQAPQLLRLAARLAAAKLKDSKGTTL
jgi:hypothetical protein